MTASTQDRSQPRQPHEDRHCQQSATDSIDTQRIIWRIETSSHSSIAVDKLVSSIEASHLAAHPQYGIIHEPHADHDALFKESNIQLHVTPTP